MTGIRYLIHRPKTLLAAGALGGLGLILAACSPGTVVVIGKNINGDTLHVAMTCKTTNTSADTNCSGIVTGTIQGHTFVSTSGSGGTGDSRNFPPTNCTASPCTLDAGAEIDGTGTYQGAPVDYEVKAFDNDPPNADTDTASLLLKKPVGYTANISCNGCVEVKMLPGTTP